MRIKSTALLFANRRDRRTNNNNWSADNAAPLTAGDLKLARGTGRPPRHCCLPRPRGVVVTKEPTAALGLSLRRPRLHWTSARESLCRALRPFIMARNTFTFIRICGINRRSGLGYVSDSERTEKTF